jgi:conjugal transfer pilus assembly protein TraF
MTKFSIKLLTILTCTLLLTCPAGAGFFEKSEEGWFWYEVEPEPVEIAEEDDIEVLPEPVIAVEQPPDPAPEKVVQTPPAEPRQSAPLSAEWFRENLQFYLDRAVDDPTTENVAAYLYLQKVSLDKSQQFADTVARVTMMDPMLDENTRRSLASFGSREQNIQATRHRENLLKEIADYAGIFFFFSSDNSQDVAQSTILHSLSTNHGFNIIPISLDGRPLSDDLYPNYTNDQGQSEVLGVTQTPALFLARPDNMDVVPLGQAMLARPQLEERIILAAREAGWITEEEASLTRSFIDHRVDMDEVIQNIIVQSP